MYLCHFWIKLNCSILSWIHTDNASIFSTLSIELWHFYSDSTPPLSCKMLIPSVFRPPIESRVMSVVWNTLDVELFSTRGVMLLWRYSVLTSIYWLDAYDLKNKNAHARERPKKKNACVVSMNAAVVSEQTKLE